MRAGQRDALPRYRVATGPGPHDPLISGDYHGWWRRSLALLKAGWRPMATVQAIVTVPTLALAVPLLSSFEKQQREARAGDPLDLLFAGFPLLPAAIVVSSLLYVLGRLATAQGRTDGLGPVRTGPAGLVPGGGAAVPGDGPPVLPASDLRSRSCRWWSCWSAATASTGAFGCSTRTSACRTATILGLNIAAALVMSLMSVTLGGGLESPNTTVLDAILQGAYYVAAGLVGTPLLVTAYADMRARHEPFTTPR